MYKRQVVACVECVEDIRCRTLTPALLEHVVDTAEFCLDVYKRQPEYSNAVELSYIKNWSNHTLSVSGYLRANNDMISHVSFLAPMASDPAVNTMYYGHANVGNMMNTGVEIISRNTLFNRLTLTTTVNLYNLSLIHI